MATGGTPERHVLTLLWKVENIGFYERELHSIAIDSPYFTTRTSPTKWYLRLFPKVGIEEDDPFRVHLDLYSAAPCYPIDCDWSIFGGDGSSLVTGTVRNHVTDNFNSLSMPEFPPQEEVSVSRKSAFLPNDTLTVRCRIWKSQGNFERSEYISLRSRLELAVDSFQWPIEAFSRLPLDKKETTRVDMCIASREMPFIMHFSLKGSLLEEAVTQIELTSRRIHNKLSATLKVSVLDNEEKAMKSVHEKRMFHESEHGEGWVLPHFITRRELLTAPSDCLSGDVLTLLCELTVVVGISHFLKKTNCGPLNMTTEVARSDSICSYASCRSIATLGEDLLSLYRDHTGSDFELRSGDVSFPVHKQVLMARSPVFRAMFCSDMKESNTHSLEVPDVDAYTLNRMLTFLYAGTVDPDLQWEGAVKLYYAADKYQVPSLKQRCSSVLQNGLSLLNVGDILTLADMHQDMALTSCAQDFILRRFDAIMLSEEWDAFHERNPKLAGTTMKQVYKEKLQMKRSQ